MAPLYNIDKLYEAVAQRGHVCVGLDTSPDYIPPSLLRSASSDAEAILAFNKTIIDATADSAACFKVQIAYYEAMGRRGLDVYAKTLSAIREKSLVIADVKRGDIADTASQYAKAHFEGDFEADFVTLSPYLGMDSLEPWLAFIHKSGKGAFVLMKTSNKGSRDFQYLELAGASRFFHAVGDKLTELSQQYMGKYGYGAFGAVVGVSNTEREEAAAIRKRYGSLFFLIPGYGAQGGAAEEAALLLLNGNGGVVNASRSILKAWTLKADAEQAGKEISCDSVAEAAREAVIGMRDAIQAAVKK